jgi:hypothetical protein
VPVHIGPVPGLPVAEAGWQDEEDPAARRPPPRGRVPSPGGRTGTAPGGPGLPVGVTVHQPGTATAASRRTAGIASHRSPVIISSLRGRARGISRVRAWPLLARYSGIGGIAGSRGGCAVGNIWANDSKAVADIRFGPEPVVVEDRGGTAVQVSLDLGPLRVADVPGADGQEGARGRTERDAAGVLPSPPARRMRSVARRPRSGQGREGRVGQERRVGRGPGFGVHLCVVSPRTLAASSIRR